MARRKLIDTSIYALVLQYIFLIFLVISQVLAYECIEKCGPYHRRVYHSPDQADCLVSMPDNPYHQNNQIVPCQIEILANCTEFCYLSLNFAKLDLPSCSVQNMEVNTGDICQHVNSCEYVVLRETGVDAEGLSPNHTAYFHGNLTKSQYSSTTNKVSLHFCYRSETFTARNIRLLYHARDPKIDDQTNLGPVSVWVLSVLVIFLILAIVAVARCPLLKVCLD